MADVLSNIAKVNQPSNNGYENNLSRNTPNAVNGTQIPNLIDPSRVNRPDGKAEAEDKRFAFNNESNFGKFVQLLKTMPGLQEVFSKLLFVDAQNMITSGLGEKFTEELAAFMQMIQMEPEQLLGYLKNLSANSGQFGGVFFQALKEVLEHTGSVELRAGILNFLKQYSNMASGPHLMNNIREELNAIFPYMFKADAGQLKEIMDRLIFDQPEPGAGQQPEAGHTTAAGEKAQEQARGGQAAVSQNNRNSLLEAADANVRHNSQVLKEELIPFFSKYVSRTRDMGKARDIMTLITLNVARYVNGSKEEVVQSFEKLLQYGEFRQKLGDIKEENLEVILNRLLTERKDGEQNPWTERFVSLLRSGLSGEGGYEAKVVFQNIMNAMLLNESVYMPLLHLMLPLNINGNLMFSELWVDPDSQNGYQGEDEERSVRILVKFDIKDLGYFDVILDYHGRAVDLLVAYPPKLSPLEKQIRNGLGQIVADSGLSFQSLTLEQSRRPIPLMEVFPKIAERRNSINVRV